MSTTTTFETMLTKLNEKGIALDDPEQQVPRTNKSPIPVHCQQHQEHRFIWDMKYILSRIDNPHDNSYSTFCHICIGTIITERDAKQVCQNLQVEFVRVSDDKNTYYYRLPCGHEQYSQKKTLKNMTQRPFCTTCLDERRSKQDPLEYPLLKKFQAKIQRLRKKSFDFTEKIPEVLNHIHKRLTDMNIGMHQIGFDEDENDVWIYMKCEGDDYCHRNTINLIEMIQQLKYVNLGSIKSVCHECCHNK